MKRSLVVIILKNIKIVNFKLISVKEIDIITNNKIFGRCGLELHPHGIVPIFYKMY